jgi:hypothetical protein
MAILDEAARLRVGGKSLKTSDLILEISSLPVEERARVADSILRSLNPPDSDVDAKWAAVAERRLAESRSGLIQSQPGGDVFAKIWKRFAS